MVESRFGGSNIRRVVVSLHIGDLKAAEPSSDRLHPLIKLPGIIILVGATFVVVFGILIPTGIIPLEGKMTTWTAINQTFMPVGLWVNGRGLRTSRPLETWTSKDPSNIFSDNDKSTYTFKGYEFIPGMGNLFGWQEDGTNVYGEEGKLVFCKTYTWDELKDTDFTITITLNIPPRIIDDPSDPCPENNQGN